MLCSRASHYGDDPALPIYSYQSSEYTVEDIVNLLVLQEVDETKIARAPPVAVNTNASFLVDLSCLKHSDDVKADDLGVWKSVGSPSHLVVVDDEDGCLSATVLSRGKKFKDVDAAKRQYTYRLTRSYYRHSTSPDFHRIVNVAKGRMYESRSFNSRIIENLFIVDYQGQQVTFAFVQYYFDHEEHPVEVGAHGNSKGNKRPFNRTLTSTLAELKQKVKVLGSGEGNRRINASVGGSLKSRSAGELVRNKKQAYNAKQLSKSARKDNEFTGDLRRGVDPYASVMLKCNRTAGKKQQAFVRKVELAPEPRIVLATELQLDLLEKFSTNPSHFAVVAADPTFNCGDFDVTAIAFRHLMLNQGYSSDVVNHPLLIGPMMIHHRKTYESYSCLFSTLRSLRPGLNHLKAFGTDGETNLSKAMI